MTNGENTKRDWTKSSFGERIDYICALKGWTLTKLGEEAGIASGPMSRLHNKTATIAEATPESLVKLAEAGGVSILWLMLGRGPVHSVPDQPGMLRLHPDWPKALAEAKKNQRGIPNEFWNMAGDSVIHLPRLDWQLIVGLVREFYWAWQRGPDA